jgi:toluene monooxygenase electron transfer component
VSNTPAAASGSFVEGGPEFRVTLDGSERSFIVRQGEPILSAARRAGHWLPFECGWGSCSRCKATLVDGELASLFPNAPAIDARDERRRRYLMCQSTPLTDLVIKPFSVADEAPVERPTADYLGTLVHCRPLGPSIAEFRFELTDSDGSPATAVFRPGQYATLHIDEGLSRCYSMANLPGSNTVDFIIKHYDGHLGSTRMFGLAPGATVPIELPYGDMWLRDVERPVLMIAGGTGVSAILSLARSIVDDPRWIDTPVHVLYGAATREELVCWEELEDLSDGDHTVHLHGSLVHVTDDWSGGQGLITASLSALLSAELAVDHDLANAEIYLAGPPPMVKAVQAVLNEHGIQLDRIHVDSFG